MVEAQVAAVLSDRELAFNAGSEAGVAIDDVATIFEETSVKDPVTGERLGVVRRVSFRLRITEVQPKLSVGRTFELVRQSGSRLLVGLADQEVVRVTAAPGAVNWFTLLVKTGEPTVIDRPPPPPQNEAA